MSETRTQAQNLQPPKKTILTRRNGSKLVDFLLVLPALAFLALFTYYPVAKLVQISFTD